MKKYSKLLEQLKFSQPNNKKLDLNETIVFLEQFKFVTQEKKLLEKLIHNLTTIQTNKNSIKKLTKRENEICKLIGLGFNSKEIARLLNLSIHTVRTHRKNTIKKLKLSGSGQLEKYAFVIVNKK